MPIETDYAVAVMVPPFELSTAEVYRRWDEMDGPAGVGLRVVRSHRPYGSTTPVRQRPRPGCSTSIPISVSGRRTSGVPGGALLFCREAVQQCSGSSATKKRQTRRSRWSRGERIVGGSTGEFRGASGGAVRASLRSAAIRNSPGRLIGPGALWRIAPRGRSAGPMGRRNSQFAIRQIACELLRLWRIAPRGPPRSQNLSESRFSRVAGLTNCGRKGPRLRPQFAIRTPQNATDRPDALANCASVRRD